MFGESIKDKFHVESQDSEPAELTDNNLNALRDAAGYVPCKLRQKYRKPTCKHPNRKAFLVCLDKLSEGSQEESEDSYLDYTKRWICAVDLGGLFRINNEVYVLFMRLRRKYDGF